MSILKDRIKEFPKTPGVYRFIGRNGGILYVGKAKNLQNRLKSYFLSDIGRGPAIDIMIAEADDIKYIETESEIEAVILEADLIGKLKPKYNIRQKDDKSFLMIRISKEDFPKVSLIRYKNIDWKDKSAWYFGPYPQGDALKRSMRYLRRIFPYYDCSEVKYSKARKASRPCLYGDLGICEAPCVDRITKKDYNKNITYLKNFLRGKKKEIIRMLYKEMDHFSQNNKFEAAAITRDRINALESIGRVVVGLRDDFTTAAKLAFKRIECYDIANISGQYCVGSMVVFTNGEADKGEYRKFKVKSVFSCHPRAGEAMIRGSFGEINVNGKQDSRLHGNDTERNGGISGVGDIQMMAEVLDRRFNNDWPLPNLLIIDGGAAHLNVAIKILKERKLDIPVVSIAKGPKRDKNEFHYSNHAIAEYIQKNQELKIIAVKARDEAHRFAQSYYKKLHSKGMME